MSPASFSPSYYFFFTFFFSFFSPCLLSLLMMPYNASAPDLPQFIMKIVIISAIPEPTRRICLWRRRLSLPSLPLFLPFSLPLSTSALALTAPQPIRQRRRVDSWLMPFCRCLFAALVTRYAARSHPLASVHATQCALKEMQWQVMAINWEIPCRTC